MSTGLALYRKVYPKSSKRVHPPTNIGDRDRPGKRLTMSFKTITLQSFLLTCSLWLAACVDPQDVTTANGPSIESAVLNPASGERAVKILFTASDSGSFDPSPTSTPAVAGSGYNPKRIFRPDGSLIADDGPTDADWPKWLSDFEIGISGTNNSSAQHPDCARFATAALDGVFNCDIDGDGTKNESCGAAAGEFRVSEIDCASGTILDGNGGGSDGVYFRAYFNQNLLGSHENVLAVLEYTASTLNPSPTTPTNCFNGDEWTPTNTNCADQSWQGFVKSTAFSVVVPFTTIVPPSSGHVDTTKKRAGGTRTTIETVIPLAIDPTITVFQVSRIRAIPLGTTNFSDRCGSNSAKCVGMILHSLTLYRI